MAQNLNIYGITDRRDELIINQFIDKFVDRSKSENREDEELMLIPLVISKNHLESNDYDWEPAQTLTHITKRGLDYPRRAFTVYLQAKDSEVDHLILSFTTDDQLVVGLSIDDEGMKPENEQKAKKILNEIMQDFKCHSGLIAVEMPPPANQSEFLSQTASTYTVFFRSDKSSGKSSF